MSPWTCILIQFLACLNQSQGDGTRHAAGNLCGVVRFKRDRTRSRCSTRDNETVGLPAQQPM